ncbi:hypothetical protein TI39_contig62g00009, partial [Zymoseptoria brevis]
SSFHQAIMKPTPTLLLAALATLLHQVHADDKSYRCPGNDEGLYDDRCGKDNLHG